MKRLLPLILLLFLFMSCFTGCDSDVNSETETSVGTDKTEDESLVTNPTEEYIISCLESTPNITEVCAVTEENDPNGNLNTEGGYYSTVYFSVDLLKQDDIDGNNLIEKGTDAGGCIEAYKTVQDALDRNYYLKKFDNKGPFDSGSHTVIGTIVIRTSKHLTEEQQSDLEFNLMYILMGGDSEYATPVPTPEFDGQTIEETTEAIIAETESEEVSTEEPTEGVADMEVHFIDVGQGDATLVKADDKYMLIDAGDNSKGTAVQNYLKKQGVKKLDYLILTHTDADHIGGADVIITKFDIDTLFIGDFKKDNKTYEELINAIDYKNLKYSTPAVGNEYMLGNAIFTIVAPNTIYDDPNNSSIALLLRNGEDTFLFTGDCEEEAETDILANGIDIDCDVYKVGHHGSKTASSKDFLKAITPTYGVISCAEENSYGHPHAEALNNLRSMNVEVFRTDEQGSIVAYSNGTEITWNCAPSETWKAGEPKEDTVKKVETPKAVEPTPAPESTPAPEPAPAPEPNPEPVVDEPVAEEPVIEEPVIETPVPQTYMVIGNKNTKAFHRESCSRLPKEKNRVYFNSRDEALAAGYHNPCDYCNP